VTANGSWIGLGAVQTLVVDLGPALQASGRKTGELSGAATTFEIGGGAWKRRRHGFFQFSLAVGSEINHCQGLTATSRR
jgi:hypothetical protein